MGKRPLVSIIALLVVAGLVGAGVFVYRTFAAIPEMFSLNRELRAEGYYMGEFEFKMLGVVYYLDKGEYVTAISRLNQIYRQLKTREGLIRVPRFAAKQEELDFYLNLQNPRTGAFMDDSYPLCTYVGPTFNMVNHLESLAKEAGRPLQLKYPLCFLDQLNSGEKLKAYLDDLATVGPIASKLPKTPFILAFEIIYYSDIERVNLYSFSPEWKKALLQWFYENQDKETGYWGPRLRSGGQLLEAGYLTATSPITGLFVDKRGDNRYPDFPLRYKDRMFRTTLHKLSAPMPENLAEQHGWSLDVFRAVRLLTNYLWSDGSPENKNSARKIIGDVVRGKFAKCYIPEQGAFSYYSGSAEADLDGTGEALDLLDNIGALSPERRERLWGSAAAAIIDLGTYEVSKLKQADFTAIKNAAGVNSLRLYWGDPAAGGYLANVAGVVYPEETPVLDVADLLPKVAK